MLFSYTVINEKGQQVSGEIETQSQDLAISSLQKRGFIVVSVKEAKKGSFLQGSVSFFDHVPLKDLVIMSRQVSALFEAQVPAVKTFTLLVDNVQNPMLQRALEAIIQDIQAGVTIAGAMQKHPKIFSDFYVSMIRAGEESGRLTETFTFLASYLERQYELVSKVRNAMVYPVFIFFVFIVVMVLVLVMIIPQLSQIILDSGQDIPFYTQVVMGMSDFLVNYGFLLLIGIMVGGYFAWRGIKSPKGQAQLDRIKISAPVFGGLFQKFYLSRIADNLTTMLSAGIPVVRALEITGSVVGNGVYENIIKEAIEGVKGGSLISTALSKHEEMPSILVQMLKVGEETGSLSSILETLARFYKREVNNAVDTLIGLIEPVMIIMLALGVGFLLTSVLLPIYNIAGGF